MNARRLPTLALLGVVCALAGISTRATSLTDTVIYNGPYTDTGLDSAVRSDGLMATPVANGTWLFTTPANVSSTLVLDAANATPYGWCWVTNELWVAVNASVQISPGNFGLENLLRRYSLTGGSPPTGFTLLETKTLSTNTVDNRIFGLYHSTSGATYCWTRNQTNVVAPNYSTVFNTFFQSPSGVWTTNVADFSIPSVTSIGTINNPVPIYQHPTDGSIWAFYNRDSSHYIYAFRITESGGGYTVANTYTNLIGQFTDGNINGPDGELNGITCQPNVSANTLRIGYCRFQTDFFVPNWRGAQITFADISANGSRAFSYGPTNLACNSGVGDPPHFIITSGPEWAIYRPVTVSAVNVQQPILLTTLTSGTWATNQTITGCYPNLTPAHDVKNNGGLLYYDCVSSNLHLLTVNGPKAWYVDNTATGTADGSSWANAFTHLSQLFAAPVGPGDTIYVSGGPVGSSQTYGGILRVSNNGTSVQPITITIGQDPAHGGTAIFDGGDGAETFSYVELSARQYVTINGSYRGGYPGKLAFNNLPNPNRTDGNKILADSSTGCQLLNLNFTNVNQCVSLVGAQSSVVRGIIGTDIRGDAGIRAVSCGPAVFDGTIVEANDLTLSVCTNCGPTIFGPDGIQGAQGMTIRYNTIRTKGVGYTTSTQHPDFTQLTGNFNKIYGNWFIDANDAACDWDLFANSTPHDNWTFNNVFVRATNCLGSLSPAPGPHPFSIRIYSSGGPATSLTNLKIWNNIFADNSGTADIQITWPGTPTLSGCSIADNIFLNSGGYLISTGNPNFSPAAMGFASNVYTGGGTWSVNGTVYDTNSWVAAEPTRRAIDPAFVSYVASCLTNDFRLRSTDIAAHSQGVNLSAYFTTDRNGLPRPATGPWDIGPYQSTGPAAPNTPINVSPASGATGVVLNPTLQASAYSDPASLPQIDAHFTVYGPNTTMSIAADSGTGLGAVTSWTTPALLSGQTYWWSAQYQNSAGVWSALSRQTSFVTAPTNTSRVTVRAITTRNGQIIFP